MQKQPGRPPSLPRTKESAAVSRCVVSTSSSRVLPENEPNTTHGMDEFHALLVVDFASKVGDVDINHVVQRRRAVRFTPHVLCEHLPCDRVSVIAHKISEEVELARREGNYLCAALHPTILHVQREVADLLAERLSVPNPPEQCCDTREQFGKRERLHEVIIRSAVEA